MGSVKFEYTVKQEPLVLNNNCLMYKNGVLFKVGDVANIGDEVKLVCNDGYAFSGEVKFLAKDQDYGDTSYLNFKIDETKKIASFKLENIDGGNYVLTIAKITTSQVVENNPMVIFEYTENQNTIVLNNHCLMYKNGVLFKVGDVANIGDEVKLVCNKGYAFSGEVKFLAKDQDYGSFTYLNFKIDETKKIASFKLENIDGGNYKLTLNTITTSQLDEVIGSNSIFKITGEELSKINKERFVSIPDKGIIDYGVNILGVINLPLEIPEKYIQESELIRLGTHSTEVTAPKISTDKLFYDLGNIEIPKVENTVGYGNTEVILHLPLAPSIQLDLDYSIGYTINVEYVINLYNGDTTINIKSSKTDNIVATASVNLGVEVPYIYNDGKPRATNLNVVLGGDNHIRSPFIEIVRNIPILENGFFTSPIIDENILNGEKGFVTVEDIELKTNALSYEKNMIINALKSGVIIK